MTNFKKSETVLKQNEFAPEHVMPSSENTNSAFGYACGAGRRMNLGRTRIDTLILEARRAKGFRTLVEDYRDAKIMQLLANHYAHGCYSVHKRLCANGVLSSSEGGPNAR